MAEVTLELLGSLMRDMLVEQRKQGDEQRKLADEQRAMRLELRRLAENQMMITRSLERLREELELMIRTEIGGLFAHLETRLEQRIDALVAPRV